MTFCGSVERGPRRKISSAIRTVLSIPDYFYSVFFTASSYIKSIVSVSLRSPWCLGLSGLIGMEAHPSTFLSKSAFEDICIIQHLLSAFFHHSNHDQASTKGLHALGSVLFL